MSTQVKSVFDTPGQSPFSDTATSLLKQLVANREITQEQMQHYLDMLNTGDKLWEAVFGRPAKSDEIPSPLPLEAVHLMHEQANLSPRKVIDWLNKLTFTSSNVEAVETLLEAADHSLEFLNEVQQANKRTLN